MDALARALAPVMVALAVAAASPAFAAGASTPKTSLELGVVAAASPAVAGAPSGVAAPEAGAAAAGASTVDRRRFSRALSRTRARLAAAARSLRARVTNARPLRRWFSGTTGAAGTRGTAFPRISLTSSQRAGLVRELSAAVQQARIARAPIPSPVYLTLPLRPRGASSSGYQTLPLAPRSGGQGSYQALPGIAGYAVIPAAQVASRNIYDSASSPLNSGASRGPAGGTYGPGPVLRPASSSSGSTQSVASSSSSATASAMRLPAPRNAYDVVPSAPRSGPAPVNVKYPEGRSAIFARVPSFSSGSARSAGSSAGLVTTSGAVTVRYPTQMQQIRARFGGPSGSSAGSSSSSSQGG